MALIVILLNGGMDIGWRRFRALGGADPLLGVLGTFVTAGVVALCAHYVLGFGWVLAGLVGAAVAPTDPAVMFSVLGGREIEGRSGTTLEGEAGVNDPAGIALMLGMIELATHDGASFWSSSRSSSSRWLSAPRPGWSAPRCWSRSSAGCGSRAGAHPVFALALPAALYGATSLAHGSGFLAVFIAGLFLGNANPYKLRRSSASTARWPSSPSSPSSSSSAWSSGSTRSRSRSALDGIALVLALAVLVRPPIVLAALAPVQLHPRRAAFIAWCGLKGAVPILLAAFAVLQGVGTRRRSSTSSSSSFSSRSSARERRSRGSRAGSASRCGRAPRQARRRRRAAGAGRARRRSSGRRARGRRRIRCRTCTRSCR